MCYMMNTLVFSREFKDWHLRWGNGFQQITRQWLVGSLFFSANPNANKNAEKISPLARLFARALKIRI